MHLSWMLWPSVALILSSIVLVRSDPTSSSSDLMALCSGKDLKIKTVSQFLGIDQALRATKPAECKAEVRTALEDMAAIARDKSACTMKKARALSKFVENHLKIDKNTRLPEPLVKFAIAYGMRVSNVCKRNIMNAFSDETYARLREKFQDDFWTVTDYLRKYSPLSYALIPIYKAAEVVLPSDLLQLVPGMGIKLGGRVPDRKTLAKLKLVCTETFQPLYERTLLPVAQLIRTGFDYPTSSYRKENKKVAQFWFVTVFLCELLKTVETTDKEDELDVGEVMSSAEEKTPAMNPKSSDLPEERETPEIDEQAARAKGGAREGAPNGKVERKRKSFLSALERYKGGQPLVALSYNIRLGDEILGDGDSDLKTLVKSFDANKNEVDRVREKILDRSLAIFKMIFKKSGGGPILKKLFACFKSNSNSELDKAKETLLELASAPEANSMRYYAAKTPVYAYKASKWVSIKLLIIVGLFGLLIPAAVSERASDQFEDLFNELIY